MGCRISRGVLAAIIADARATPALERCGLLLGQGDDILDWQAAANVHADPARHFELDPAALIAAERAARGPSGAGRQVLGHYHSHPAGAAAPSLDDAAAAAPDGRLWLIINANEVSLWRSVADGERHGRFCAEPLAILD